MCVFPKLLKEQKGHGFIINNQRISSFLNPTPIDPQNKGCRVVKGNVNASFDVSSDIDIPSACLLFILSDTGRSSQADRPNFLSLLNPVSGVGVTEVLSSHWHSSRLPVVPRQSPGLPGCPIMLRILKYRWKRATARQLV